MSAIHYACLYDHLEIVKLLVEKGADVNMPSRKRLFPIMYASRNGNL